MKEIKAITNFTWQGQDGSFLIREGEIIKVDAEVRFHKSIIEELEEE